MARWIFPVVCLALACATSSKGAQQDDYGMYKRSLWISAKGVGKRVDHLDHNTKANIRKLMLHDDEINAQWEYKTNSRIDKDESKTSVFKDDSAKAVGRTKDQSRSFGVEQPSDKILSTYSIRRRGITGWFVQETDQYRVGKGIIHCIRVWDQMGSGRNAAFSLVEGGPNAAYVKLNFTSQMDYGIDYKVIVYGR